MCIPFLSQNSTLTVNLTFDNIRIAVASKMFLFFSSSFLLRIQQKEVEVQTFLGFVLLIWLSVEKLYLDA